MHLRRICSSAEFAILFATCVGGQKLSKLKVLERVREGGDGEKQRIIRQPPFREVSEVRITFGSDQRGELSRISRRRAVQPVNNYPR